ncbi:MAG: hypothetical protein OXB95_03940 [Rhodobacteraceae bacterium]|nr:hypothetical protein [Paracoccaceae bacterium]
MAFLVSRNSVRHCNSLFKVERIAAIVDRAAPDHPLMAFGDLQRPVFEVRTWTCPARSDG